MEEERKKELGLDFLSLGDVKSRSTLGDVDLIQRFSITCTLTLLA